ncbi:TonB-dependent receptor domain-containing protein, partial [Steroidobacter sp.]|uniref:TonB-dependent receptor domain-containing protein n=1 Tax=Steroidobacter sp. TaxID=1978227 RepID=UPI001A3F7966
MRSIIAATVACLIAGVGVADQARTAIRKPTNIPAQNLGVALQTLARQYDVQIVYFSKSIDVLETPGAVGELTIDEALGKILSGSGLVYRYLDDSTITIVPPKEEASAGGNVSGAETANKSAQIEEIVVTATRRAESLQNVPMSITALSAESLQQRGVKDFEGFVRTVPGLSVNAARENQPQFVIRGISTQSGIGNTQLPVATYIDDLPSFNSYAPLYTLDLRLFDAERVEILRGPQGTLFGSGAVGGAIRVITEKPDASKFDAKAEVTGASTREGDASYGVDAMVNVPLVEDKLALRIVGYDAERGGYVDNALRGNDMNNAHVRGGRAMLQWTPHENLTVLTSFITQEKEVDDDAFVFATSDSLSWNGGAANREKARFTDYNLVVNWDMGPATLTSSTNSASEKPVSATDLSPYYGPGAVIEGSSNADFFTQELRLTSNGTGPFGYLLGAFYIERDRQYHAELLDVTDGSLLYSEDSDLPTEEVALFGELSYRVTPTLKLTAGARTFRNKNAAQSTVDGLFIGDRIVGPRRRSTEEKTTPKFAITWEPSRDLTVYGVASEGYRVGHVNPVVPPDPLTGASRESAYGPDSLWNYEIGVKSYLFDRTLRANLALFDIDWRDIQINQQYSDGFNYTANAGKASSRGVELELEAHPLESLTLVSAMSYIDAQLDQDAPAIGGRKGNRLPGSSRFQISNAVQYQAP